MEKQWLSEEKSGEMKFILDFRFFVKEEQLTHCSCGINCQYYLVSTLYRVLYSALYCTCTVYTLLGRPTRCKLGLVPITVLYGLLLLLYYVVYWTVHYIVLYCVLYCTLYCTVLCIILLYCVHYSVVYATVSVPKSFQNINTIGLHTQCQ